MTMPTASGQGGTQGAHQGSREFSLTASWDNLPVLTSENRIQGGTAQGGLHTRKSPETRDKNTPNDGPSPSGGAGDHDTTVSRCLTNPRHEPDREDVTVHLPIEQPSLTTPVSRTLLAILHELTTVEILNTPPGRGPNDH
jgi:hypothetical protein